MDTEQKLAQLSTTWSDSAVNGLLSGVAAGVAMAVVLVVAGLAGGRTPAAVLALFDAAQGASALSGALIHLAVSGVYGLLFGLAWHGLGGRRYAPPGWLAGLIYGGLLLAIAEVAFLADMPSPLRDLPLALFAAAHGVYGLVLGWLVARQ